MTGQTSPTQFNPWATLGRDSTGVPDQTPFGRVLHAIGQSDTQTMTKILSSGQIQGPQYAQHATIALSERFTVSVADLLSEHHLISYPMLLKKDIVVDGALRWCGRNKQSILDAGKAVIQSEMSPKYQIQEDDCISRFISRVSAAFEHNPRQVALEVMGMDIVALSTPSSKRGPDQQPTCLLIELLKKACKLNYQDFEILGPLADRLLSDQVVQQMMSSSAKQRGRNSYPVEILLNQAIGERYKERTIENYQWYERLKHHSQNLQEREMDYWDYGLSDAGANKALSRGYFRDTTLTFRTYKGVPRCQNITEALVRTNPDWVKEILLEQSDNAEALWNTLASGANMAGIIQTYSGMELNAFVNEATRRLGYDWTDEQGNTLAHLMVTSCVDVERMVMTNLSASSEGMGLMYKTNHAKKTPLDLMLENTTWKAYKGQFERALGKRRSKILKSDLSKIAKASTPTRAKKAKPFM